MFYGSVIPDSVMSLRTIKEGPKLLLARLYKFAGDKDHCNPALPTLARALGTSEDKIGRWLKDLEKHRFIRTVRHARREAERFLLWHSDLSPSLRSGATGVTEHDSAKARNHNEDDESAELRNHRGMIPQNRGDDSAKTGFLIRKKRIIEENHHRSATSASTESDDDDLNPSLRVKTLLMEFFSTRGLRLPSGEVPAVPIAEVLVRHGRGAVEGTTQFLGWYGDNLRDPPVTWKHVAVSFESWTTKLNRTGIVEIRKGPRSELETTPKPSRYQLAKLADPFDTNFQAAAV
jgi:Helix-turn-helix domain